MGIFRYESLAHFWSEYRPEPGYPRKILQKGDMESGYIVMIVQLAAGPSFALLTLDRTEGRAYITDDIDKLLPLYRHLS